MIFDKNKPEYLWPQMIWQTLHFIVISIGVIIIFALALFFGSGDLPRNVDHNTQRLLETAQNYRFPVLLLAFGILGNNYFFISFGILNVFWWCFFFGTLRFTALAFYLLKVVIIYYQEMKKEIPAYTQTITNMERGYVPQYEPQAVQLDHMSGAFKQ